MSVLRHKEPIDPDVYYRDAGDNEDAQAAFRSFADTMESYKWFIVREAPDLGRL